jgi:hypothetical protein
VEGSITRVEMFTWTRVLENILSIIGAASLKERRLKPLNNGAYLHN